MTLKELSIRMPLALGSLSASIIKADETSAK
jgi:hypothetical protein